jgi:septal ring factor EnvC (AmiA/AmiB activator)
MWEYLAGASVILALAFCWLAYQLHQGGKSNEALQTELRVTRSALAETNKKNQELQAKLKETDIKLDSCTKALNDQ